jgi:hypothetical protein
MLRKGVIGDVSFQRIVALARFFRVPLESFRQEGPPDEPVDACIQDALAQPLIRELVLRVGNLSVGQRALVLEMLAHMDHEPAENASHPEQP